MKRIEFKLPLSFVIMLVLFVFNSCTQKTSRVIESKEPADLVYPFLDSENSRWFFFSSACRSFGMVNLSPDTHVNGAWGSGYRYKTDTIKGFSHIHAWQLSGLSVMPVIFSKENKSAVFTDFNSKFSHETKKASPGYHLVQLAKYQITAELTSTKRVGFPGIASNNQKIATRYKCDELIQVLKYIGNNTNYKTNNYEKTEFIWKDRTDGLLVIVCAGLCGLRRCYPY